MHPLRKLSIVISEACNLNCKYCYARLSNKWSHSDQMTNKIAKLVFNQLILSAGQCDFIQFFGGEPSLNLDVIETISELVQKSYLCGDIPQKPRIGIVTNGVFGDYGRTFDIFKKYNIEVTVSIDGPPEIHNHLRPSKTNNTTYDLAYTTINEALNSNLVTILEMVYTSYHINQEFTIKNALEFCCSLGVSKIAFQTATPPAPIDLIPVSESHIDRLINYFDEAIDWWFYNLIEKDILTIDIYFKDILLAILKGINAISPNGCPAGETDLAVGPDGSIYPCQLLYGNRNVFMGNIHKFDILKYNKIDIPHLYSDFESCRTCHVRFWCQPCPALNTFWGDILTPSSSECIVRQFVICKIAKLAFDKLNVPETPETKLLKGFVDDYFPFTNNNERVVNI